MRLGFSYVGLIFLLMLMVPNLAWARRKPAGYDQAPRENRALLCLERAGEAAVTCLSLIFADFNLKPLSLWSLWLAGAAALMILYEVFWARYFRGPRTMESFYSSLLGIPVAGATLPVAAFLLLAVYGKNPLLGLATVVLGVGHIGIHLGHRRELTEKKTRI